MTLVEIRDAILEQLRQALPALREVTPGRGRIDAAELQRLVLAAPCLSMAVLGLRNVQFEPGQGVCADVQIAAFLVARNQPGTPRGDAILALAQGVVSTVSGNLWGLSDSVSEPVDCRADNLYSAAVDSKGLALWAVPWRQRFVLDAGEAAYGLDDFLRAHLAWDVVPGDGEPEPEDMVHLPGPEED